MANTKLIKTLLSEAYEVEGELLSFIEQCFKELFKDDAVYAFSLFEEDVDSGRDYNGCIQNLDFFQRQVEENRACMKKYKEQKESKKEVE